MGVDRVQLRGNKTDDKRDDKGDDKGDGVGVEGCGMGLFGWC